MAVCVICKTIQPLSVSICLNQCPDISLPTSKSSRSNTINPFFRSASFPSILFATRQKCSFCIPLFHRTKPDLLFRSLRMSSAFLSLRLFHLHSINAISLVSSFKATISISYVFCPFGALFIFPHCLHV